MNSGTRAAVVAGRFYPGDPAELRRTVADLLAGAAPWQGEAPKALIAPHAGYPYSGPIAATAYRTIEPGRNEIRRVVLISPSHFVRFQGVAAVSAAFFETPLGPVPVDSKAFGSASSLPQWVVNDEAHAREHGIEVHLPFLQVLLPEFSIVPVVVGEASEAEVSEVMDALWDGDDTLVVVSSDLSHYYDSQTARRLDHATAQAIESLSPAQIGGEGACGRVPICGLLEISRRLQLKVRTIDLRNSGDTAGPRHQVVGYGAFVFGARL